MIETNLEHLLRDLVFENNILYYHILLYSRYDDQDIPESSLHEPHIGCGMCLKRTNFNLLVDQL